jgi:hypothetical protein
MQLIQFQSPNPLTVFAPSWNFIMGEADLKIVNKAELFKKLADIILSKENSIKNTYTEQYQEYNKEINEVFDGGTGLGDKSLTSRSPFYNLLTWEENEVAILKMLVYNEYIKFLSILNVDRRTVWIQCWANVLRDSEEIKEHIHASHPLTWLGGHVTVACTDTSTFYVNPMTLANGRQVHESKNVVGKLTLFQNNLPHYTNLHSGSTERISIAFDIIPQERYEEYPLDKRAHYILFDQV